MSKSNSESHQINYASFNEILIEDSPLLICYILPDGKIDYVNKSYCTYFGKTKEELLGNSFFQFITETCHKSITDEINSLSKDNPIQIHEHEVITKNSDIRWYRWTNRILFDKNKEFTAYLSIGEDITQIKVIENELKEKREQIEFAVKSADIGIWQWRIPENIFNLNELIFTKLGYKKDELEISIATAKKMIYHEDYYRVSNLFIDYLEGHTDSFEAQCRVLTKNGKKIWVLLKGDIIERDSDNNPLQVAGTIIDINAQKEFEDALKQSEERLLEAQRIAHIGSWELDLVTNKLSWTDEIYRMFDMKPQSFKATYEAFLEAIHPDDRDVVNKAYSESLENKTQYNIDHRLLLKDNTIKYVNERCETYYDTAGKPIRSIGTVHDITERKIIEQALKKSEEKYRHYINNAPYAVFVIDKSGKFLEANKAASTITGYTNAELLQMTFIQLVAPETKRIAMLGYYRLLNKGKFTCEIECKRKDGTCFWFNLKSVKIDEKQYISFCQDITEKKRLLELEARAQRLETAGSIAGQVAHDFNNLLGPLTAYPELIRSTLPDDSKAHKFVDSIEKVAGQIAEINQQLLTLGRRGNFKQVPLNLNNLINHIINEIQPLPEKLIITYCLSDNLMNMSGDESQLYRALLNLIHNARDAMHDEGEIIIKTENYYVDNDAIAYDLLPKGEYIKLTISDTGGGVPKDKIQKIFDPFYTTKTTDKKKGSGLGLSIVDAVVKDHNGYIDLDSIVDRGTTFYLYFPISRQAITAEETTDVVGGDETILVVDDDEMQLEVSIHLLERLGYHIQSAESGEKALEMIKNNQYDLIMLDMVMPNGWDGAETFKKILEINPEQKAIVVSGFSESERVKEIKKLGCTSFVKKPLTLNQIAKVLRFELDKKPQSVTY